MQDGDKDLQDLERLFGHVKADYQAMRHEGILADIPARRRSPRSAYIYGAASVAAVLMVAIVGTNLPTTQPSQSHVRLTIPDRGTLPLSLRPSGKIKPRTLSAKTSVSLRLPRRPVAKKGGGDASGRGLGSLCPCAG